MVTRVSEKRSTGLLDPIASGPALRLVRALLVAGGPRTGRALSREAGVPPGRAAEALRRLVEAGILVRRRAGSAYLYWFKRGAYVVEEVLLPALRAEALWVERLGKEVMEAAGPEAVSVILYGSLARGEAGPHSDVDLLVVVADQGKVAEALERLEEARGAVEERYGRSVSLLAMGADELRARLVSGDPFVREVVREGRVLAGAPIAEVAVGR